MVMALSNTSRRPLYILFLLLFLIVAVISSLKASGHSTRFLSLSSLSSHSPKSALWTTTPTSIPSPKSATIVILIDPGSNHFQRLLPTLQNIEEKFNRRLGYPIQLLTDGELPDENIRKRTDWITGGKARWCKIWFLISRFSVSKMSSWPCSFLFPCNPE